MSATDLNIGISAIPGEQIIVAALNLAGKAMDGQTPEQRKAIWDIVIDDMQWWRENILIPFRDLIMPPKK